MELINENTFPAAWLVAKTCPPGWSMTCMVKGTFKLRPGETAVLAEDQTDLTGDIYTGRDLNKPFLYPSDFAYCKPRSDAILLGTCHAPNGVPASVVPVRFRVGAWEKTLLVVGDRLCGKQATSTEPQPFCQLPLTHEYAFGGHGFARNPLGKGFNPITTRDGIEIFSLPNIETSGSNGCDQLSFEPAGFGPIPDTWPQRVGKMGTFDDRWLKENWPWFPPDIDWGFFNAAPEDQQLHPYLIGDEELLIENMHPQHAQYRTRLPGFRVRCFLEERVRTRLQLREVPTYLDTLWIDMDQEQLVLVWRGVAPVRSENLDEILYFFVMVEMVEQPARSLDLCDDALTAALIRREKEDEELEEEEPEDEEEEGADEDIDDEEAEEPGESVEEGDMESIVPVAAQPVKLAPPGTSLVEATAVETSSSLNGKSIEPENQLEPEPEESPEEFEELDETMTSEQLLEHIRCKRSLEEAELSDLDFTGMDLSNMNLRNAVLERVVLSKANLTHTDLTGAALPGINLQEARCQGADFSGADLIGARLIGCDLAGAILQHADLMGADLRNASLAAVDAQGVDFSEADLSDANLEGANLTGADLSACKLHRTNMAGANLTDTSFSKAWGRHINLEGAKVDLLKAAGANFCEGNFKHISGKETVWEEGEFYGADFSGASLPGAEFSTSYLGWAKFHATDLTEAVFDHACLVNASMVRAKLLRASMQKGDLTQTNLFESNLYEANLCFSTIAKTNLEGANLRMLKHTMDR